MISFYPNKSLPPKISISLHNDLISYSIEFTFHSGGIVFPLINVNNLPTIAGKSFLLILFYN